MSIAQQIRNEKAGIRASERRINKILSRHPDLRNEFNRIMRGKGRSMRLGKFQPMFSFAGNDGMFKHTVYDRPLGNARGERGEVYHRPLGCAGTVYDRPLGNLSPYPPAIGQGPGYTPPDYDRPVTSLGQSQTDETGSWLDSQLISDLFDFGTKIATHERVAADEQKQLEIELQTIQAKNEALDKQMALERQMARTSTPTGAVMATIQDNPLLLVGLVGLVGALVMMRR